MLKNVGLLANTTHDPLLLRTLMDVVVNVSKLGKGEGEGRGRREREKGEGEGRGRREREEGGGRRKEGILSHRLPHALERWPPCLILSC
jgi:hypothetical protein